MGNNNGGCSLRLAIIYWPLVPKQRGRGNLPQHSECRERGEEKREREMEMER